MSLKPIFILSTKEPIESIMYSMILCTHSRFGEVYIRRRLELLRARVIVLWFVLAPKPAQTELPVHLKLAINY